MEDKVVEHLSKPPVSQTVHKNVIRVPGLVTMELVQHLMSWVMAGFILRVIKYDEKSYFSVYILLICLLKGDLTKSQTLL